MPGLRIHADLTFEPHDEQDAFVGGFAAGLAMGVDHRLAIVWGQASQDENGSLLERATMDGEDRSSSLRRIASKLPYSSGPGELERKDDLSALWNATIRAAENMSRERLEENRDLSGPEMTKDGAARICSKLFRIVVNDDKSALLDLVGEIAAPSPTTKYSTTTVRGREKRAQFNTARVRDGKSLLEDARDWQGQNILQCAVLAGAEAIANLLSEAQDTSRAILTSAFRARLSATQEKLLTPQDGYGTAYAEEYGTSAERLINELQLLLSSDAYGSYRRPDKISEAQAGTAVDFFFVDADRIRDASGSKTLERFQKLRELEAGTSWLVQKTITKAGVCSGDYIEEYLVISHRWEEAPEPDSQGEQFKAIREHLLQNRQIKYVW
jgi:hypothetical protein